MITNQFSDMLLLSQGFLKEGQSEYIAAYALTIAFVLLGLLVVCIPRPRTKNFVEPTEDGEDEKNKKSKR